MQLEERGQQPGMSHLPHSEHTSTLDTPYKQKQKQKQIKSKCNQNKKQKKKN